MEDNVMTLDAGFRYKDVIEDICGLNWRALSSDDMVAVAWAYYHFSVQFRENLQVARRLHPDDEKLKRLEVEECATDNLSPWPAVVRAGEKVDHDEFMRRTLELNPVDAARAREFRRLGQAYLDRVRGVGDAARAASITSYEDGGLEAVFKAMLHFSRWDNALLGGFRHFLSEHVRFDSDPEQGHGALSRHLPADDAVLPLWEAFGAVLVACAPALQGRGD